MGKNNNEIEIDNLIAEGKSAFESVNYRQAKQIFLKAIRIAPFRKDLKQMLSDSIEQEVASGSVSHEVPQVSEQSLKKPSQAIKTQISQKGEEPPDDFDKIFPHPKNVVKEIEEKKSFFVPGAEIETPKSFDPSPKKSESDVSESDTKFKKKEIARHRQPSVKLRNNNKTIMILFLFGFLSFLALSGFLFFGEGIRGALIQILKREPPIDPKQKEANQKLFEANSYLNQGLYEKAIETLEQAIKIAPPDLSAINQRMGQLYFNYGNQLYNESKFKEASIYLAKATDTVPNDTEYLNLLGHTYFSIGRQTKSKETQKTNYDKAINTYKKALAIDDKNLKVYQNLARAYIAINQPLEAVKIYQKIIDVSPEENDATDFARKRIESMTGKKIPFKTKQD